MCRVQSPGVRKRVSYSLLVCLVVFGLAEVGCDDDGSPRSDLGEGGADNAGEMIADAMTAGEMTAGAMTAGEITGGAMTAGEITGGEMIAGEEISFDPKACLTAETPCIESVWRGTRDESGVWVERDVQPQWGASQVQTLDPLGSDQGGEVVLRTLTLSVPPSSSAMEISWRGLHADRALQVGHQSWSFSGAVTIPSSVPRDAEGHLLAQEGRTGDSYFAEHGVSFSMVGGRLGAEVDAEGVPVSYTHLTLPTIYSV